MSEIARGCYFGDCLKFHDTYVCDVLPDCGQDVAFMTYLEALDILDKRSGGNSNDDIAARWNKVNERFKHGDDERLYYVVLAVLDHARLIESGVSIRCSWLTDRGEEFLDAIRMHWRWDEAGLPVQNE